ncbi:MAG: hypothetical protein J6R59_10470 [Paludibacteraceae bacterium]|nr:hypothetical protein [Paludibacteraceae bacterium]
MQKVEVYSDLIKAKNDMNSHIKSGWKIHTCTMSKYMSVEKVLVVYEK